MEIIANDKQHFFLSWSDMIQLKYQGNFTIPPTDQYHFLVNMHYAVHGASKNLK